MATWHMILQSVLFFKYEIQELNYKHDVMNWMYQVTKNAKNWSQNG